MSEDLTAILAAIRQRYANTRAPITGNSVAVLFASASDVPRLLAAVEAAMKHHVPIIRREGWHPTCSYDNHRWPCPEVRAITAALTPENVSDVR